MLCPAAAEQKQAQKFAHRPGKSLCLFYLFGQERIHRVRTGWIATARTGGEPRGEQRSPWREVSKGGQRLPWHTTFPQKV